MHFALLHLTFTLFLNQVIKFEQITETGNTFSPCAFLIPDGTVSVFPPVTVKWKYATSPLAICKNM